MMNNLKDILNSYNRELTSKLRTLIEENNVLPILNKVLNNENFDDEEITKLSEVFDKIKEKYSSQLTEDELSTLDFILIIIKNNKKGRKSFKLDDEQLDVQKKVVGIVESNQPKEGLEELKNKMYRNTKIITSLDTHFELFDELEETFDELDISTKDKIDILKQIIINNTKATEFTNEETEETEFTVQSFRYDNPESEIIDILNNYGYNYNMFDNSIKLKLLHEVNIENMKDVLSSLKNNSINIKVTSSIPSQEQFVKILKESNPSIIEELVEICRINNLPVDKVVFRDASVLYVSRKTKSNTRNTPSGDSISDSLMGTFNYFKENIEFFKSKGGNIENYYGKCSKVFCVNPKIIKTNWNVLESVYKIDMKDGNALSGLLNGNAIMVLDRYIEASPLGLELIRNSRSYISNNDDDLFYAIRYTENLPESQRLIYRDEKSQKVKKHAIKYVDVKEYFGPKEMPISDETKVSFQCVPINVYENIDESVFMLEDIKLLEENYKIDEYTYDINGTRISRQKVLRICMSFLEKGKTINKEQMLCILSYNSILNAVDVENILNYDKLKINRLGANNE